jgi:hypothetical protein
MTGIQRRQTFPPSIAEVVSACEAEVIHREKVARYASMPPAAPRIGATYLGTQGDGGPGTVYSNYDEAVKKHGRPHGVFEDGRQLVYKG